MIITRLLFLLALLMPWQKHAFAQTDPTRTPPPGAVVRAVLFYSPSCGHCEYVITQVLQPMAEQYGQQLEMIGINVSQQAGQNIYKAAMERYGYTGGGVPFLAIGDYYLVGSVDIPEKFPGLVEEYLAQGGVDWPAIPELIEALASSPAASPTRPQPTALPAKPTLTPLAEKPTSQPTAVLFMPETHSASLADKLALDPLGNGAAIFVLAGMIITVLAAVRFFRRTPGWSLAQNGSWAIPILCVIGLGVAGYLAYVETSRVTAVCGPVGDCNTVQQSEYARLLGILPIGILGLAGYLAIMAAWVIGRYTSPPLSAVSSLSLLGMTTFGVLFSIYLTFLEPFVIGATCAWCLTSAILMTVLFWLSLAPGRLAWLSLTKRKKFSSNDHQ